jgi:hypothetical protein
LEKVLRDEVLSKLRARLPAQLGTNLGLTKFDLGERSPRFSDVTVHETPLNQGIEVRSRLLYEALTNIQISTPVGQLGIEALRLSGDLVLRLEPVIDEMPVIGGLVAYFLEPPELDFTFSGLLSFGNFPGVTKIVHNHIEQMLSNYMVLPNVLAVPLASEGKGVDLAKLQGQEVVGLLQVTAIRANGLRGDDFNLFKGGFTSDPYVQVKVSDEVWRSSVVAETCDPEWKASDCHDFIVFDVEQKVRVEVFDHDVLSSDDIIGRAASMNVIDALARSDKPIPLVDPFAAPGSQKDDCGTLQMRFEFFHVVPFDPGCNTDAVLLTIKVDEVFVPRELGSSVGLVARVGAKGADGTAERATPVRKWKTLGDIKEKSIKKLNQLKRQAQEQGVQLNFESDVIAAEVEQRQNFKIELEHMLHLRLARRDLHAGGVLELMLVDSSRHVYGHTQVDLRDISAHPTGFPTVDVAGLGVPSLEFKRTAGVYGGAPLKAQVELTLRSCERGASMRPARNLVQNHPSEHGETIAWVNTLVRKAWPSTSKAIEAKLRDEIVPAMTARLPAPLKHAELVAFDLKKAAPVLGPVELKDHPLRARVDLQVGLLYDSDVEIQLKTPVGHLGINHMRLQGTLVIKVGPMIPEMPILGGYSMFFYDQPDVQFTFTGLAAFKHFPGVTGVVDAAIEAQIAKTFVMPNIFAFPMALESQGVDRIELNTPKPIGVMRVSALSATTLDAADWHLFGSSSDPYVRVRFSDEDWRSSTKNKTLNPVWGGSEDVHDFVVYDFQQKFLIEVYDADTFSSDDLLGRTKRLTAREALKLSKTQLPLEAAEGTPKDKEFATHGCVVLKFEWLQILEGAHHRPENADGWLVTVKVDGVLLPATCGDRVGLRAKVGASDKATPVKRCKTATELEAFYNRKFTKVAADEAEKGVHAEVLDISLNANDIRFDLDHMVDLSVSSKRRDMLDGTLELALITGRANQELGATTLELQDLTKAGDERWLRFPPSSSGMTSRDESSVPWAEIAVTICQLKVAAPDEDAQDVL